MDTPDNFREQNNLGNIPSSPRRKSGPAGNSGQNTGQNCARDIESEIFNDRHAVIGGLILLLAVIVIILAFIQFRHSGAFT